MTTDFDHAADLVRRYDKERYLAALLAPEAHRGALMALYAYNAEIARVRELVSEPLPGEIRLQWWRDLLSGTEHGDASANPIAEALLKTITAYKLPQQGLKAMAEARVFDLYDDPMRSLNDLEGYAGETVSGVIQLACYVLNNGENPGTATPAGHAGVAYCLTGLMRALPWHSARQQLYLPNDLLERHGVDVDSLFKGQTTPELMAALKELRGHVRHHLSRVSNSSGDIPINCRNAFLPAFMIEPILEKMDQPDYDPFKSDPAISQFRLQWIYWRSRAKDLSKL